MRLLDQVAQSHRRLLIGDRQPIPDAAGMRDRLKGCNRRLVLDREVVSFCRELVFDQPDLIESSRDLLRVPDPECWIEWEEPGTDGSEGFRVGVLLDAQPCGRRGVMRIVLEGRDGEPEVPPAAFGFDFSPAPMHPALRRPWSPYGFVLQHGSAAIDRLLTMMRGEIHRGWAGEVLKYDGRPAFERAKQRLADGLWLAPVMVIGFLLLLTANGQVEQHRVSQSVLNRRRRARGKEALLDHAEVRLNLMRGERSSHASPAATGLAGVRLHHVRGHFVRRGDAIFWRKAHMRGCVHYGEVAAKVRTVGLG